MEKEKAEAAGLRYINIPVKKDAINDELTTKVVKAGLATWGGPSNIGGRDAALIIKGQANLLNNVTALEDLESIRHLFTVLEAREQLANLQRYMNGKSGAQDQLKALLADPKLMAALNDRRATTKGSDDASEE